MFPGIFKKVIYIAHVSIISDFAGEVKKSLITPITNNPIYQTLFLGYPDMPESPDIRFDTMSNISDQKV